MTGLVATKRYLQGVMPCFSMMGVVTVYEGRHSLWTLARQLSAAMLVIALMLVILRLLQARHGLGTSLLAGWAICLPVYLILTARLGRKPTAAPSPEAGHAHP